MRYVLKAIIIVISYSSLANSMIVPFSEKATIQLYNSYQELDITSIKKYIQKGANVNYVPDKYSPTLLMFSTRQQLDHMQLLLVEGADVDAEVYSRTALHWAIEGNDPRKVNLLLYYNPKKIWTAYALLQVNPLIIGPILDKEKTSTRLRFMEIVVASSVDERPRWYHFDAVVRCFLERDIFEVKMFDYVVKKIVDNPFNNNAIQLLKLFCEYKKFSQDASITVVKRLLELKKEELSYKDFQFTQEEIERYVVNQEEQELLKSIIYILDQNKI